MRRRIVLAALLGSMVVALAIPASAEHDHYLTNPSGKCQILATGQTSISDPEHGGHHRYHWNVHKGAAEDGTLGNSPVTIALAC